MKARFLVIASLALAAAAASAQQVDSSVHVNQFPGTTVAQKLTNAMVTCTMAPASPCILVLDPSLKQMTQGTLPSLCSGCYLSDWRNGPPTGGGGSPGTPAGSAQFNSSSALTGDSQYLYVSAFNGSDWVAKATACMAQLATDGGGTCDAKSLAGSTSVSPLVVGDGVHIIKLVLGPGTYGAHNFLYRTFAQIQGAGAAGSSSPPATTLVCPNLAGAACVGDYHESSFGSQVHDPVLTGFSISDSGTATQGDGSAGLQLGQNDDVLGGDFENLWVNGFDLGTYLQSLGGCVCYNHFVNVNNTGQATASIRTMNASGYPYGINSNTWIGGDQWGPIGIWDTNGDGNNWQDMDFENNVSYTGGILYAHPTKGYGSGFAVGDTLRPNGGGNDAVLTVTSVGTGGGVTSLAVTAPGTGYTTGTDSQNTAYATTVLTGSGSGLYLDVIVNDAFIVTSYGPSLLSPLYVGDSTGQQGYVCVQSQTPYQIETSKQTISASRCAGFQSPSTALGAGDNTFFHGANHAPSSIGLSGYEQANGYAGYVAFHSNLPYDEYLFIDPYTNQPWTIPPYVPSISNQTEEVNLWPTGPAWNGEADNGGNIGPAPQQVGFEQITSGEQMQGFRHHQQMAQPGAPTVSVACTGTCTTTYTFYAVAFDSMGGETIPSAGTTITNGPNTLGTDGTITITPDWPLYPSGGPMQYGQVCWTILVNSLTVAVKNNSVGTCPNYSFGALSLTYGTQGTTAFSPLTRTNTGDEQFDGFLQLGGTNLYATNFGACTMDAATTCTVSVPSGSGNCSATVQGSTPIAAACSVSGTTATVTAASSNSHAWLVITTQ